MDGFGEPDIEMQAELNRLLGVAVVQPSIPRTGPAIAASLEAQSERLGFEVDLPTYTAGLPAVVAAPLAIPAALGALGAAVPALAGVAAAGAGVYAGLQALGLGEGEGLFGLDILSGGGAPAGGYLDGIPMGGPGLAEPPAQMVLKEWHVSYDWGRLQYYLVQMPTGGRKIAMYNTRTKKWKAWRWRSPVLAVIGKNMPSHKQLTRLKRNLARHGADAKTILKITNPTAYAKQLGYRQYKRRR